jgi:hypothetical protein
MKDLIKKYEELLEDLESKEYKESRIPTIKEFIIDLKSLNITPQLENNERLILQRLVKNEIATPRKKLGTSKMNTLYSLEGKLKK